MLLDFSQKNLRFVLEVTDEGQILWNALSRTPSHNETPHTHHRHLVDVHVSGENQGDHHFAKHTGASRSHTLTYVSHTETPTIDGREIAILLADSTLEVTVHYRFYKESVCLRAWTVVKNIANEPMDLEYISSFSYTGIDNGVLPIDHQLRIYLPHNAWQREVDWKRYIPSELGYERTYHFSGKRICLSNNGSQSTKEYLPMGAIENIETHQTMLWQIENNGSWYWEISDVDDHLYLKLSGPTETDNHWHRTLRHDEVFESVKVCVAFGQDFDEALAEMTAYRRRIINKSNTDNALPVIFNDYMNCLWANPTEENMIPVIDKAAEAGAEYYCMDAGWDAEGNWWDLVGEWQPCQKRFPHGIKMIFDYIRQKGMIPGIWLEIEVMGVQCPLAETLPDTCFLMRHGKRVIDNGRYFLDFRNPWVRDYTMSVVDRLVNEYGTGYIKNDYNVDSGIGTELNADSFGDGLLQHNRAFLSWLNEVKQKHSSLIWENCGSGGMRMDYAMLSAADIQSVSDQSDYRLNAPIAASAATAVLPEQAAIWSYPMTTDDENAVVFNMVNAMLLRIHLSGAVSSLSEQQFTRIQEGVSLYKQWRNDIPHAVPFYPLGLPQYQSGWLCAAYHTPSCIRMAIWRMDTDIDTCTIPVSGQATVRYPLNSDNFTVVSEGNTLTVTLKARHSAGILEIPLTAM